MPESDDEPRMVGLPSEYVAEIERLAAERGVTFDRILARLVGYALAESRYRPSIVQEFADLNSEAEQ